MTADIKIKHTNNKQIINALREVFSTYKVLDKCPITTGPVD